MKAMIHYQSLLMLLWAAACKIAVYLQKKSTHQILEDMTPKKAFIGKKPEIGHLKIFACLVYIQIPVEKRTKLQPMIIKERDNNSGRREI